MNAFSGEAVQVLFGDHVLDTDRRELWRKSELIPVGPQVFDILVYLIKNRDRVVTKDDLFNTVWAKRIVSESTLSTHINAVRRAVGDSGDEQRLIRTISRKGFRFVGDLLERSAQIQVPLSSRNETREPLKASETAPALPEKPSIAVLPFQNLSGEIEQEYFADGVVEDIITALSRMRHLFVIGRNSSFSYKGQSVDIKQVGRELGVRYILRGSLRRAADRVRVTGQLIDASTGTHIWGERFEGAVADIFKLQDQITANVVGALGPKLEQAEIDRARRKPTESLDAYDYFLRGMWNFYRHTEEATSEALRLFYNAIQLDPEFGSAHAMAAWCYTWRKLNGWMENRTQEISEGARLAQRSIETGKDDAVALARGGHALGFLVGDLDNGVTFVDRALLLNPNLATALVLSGLLRFYVGETELAIEHLARAMRLSPLDPTLYQMQVGTGFAHLLAGRFNEASAWAERAFREKPDYLPGAAVTAASHAQAGRPEPALHAMARVREIDPALRLSNLAEWFPIRRPEHFQIWAGGLQKAGLPE